MRVVKSCIGQDRRGKRPRKPSADSKRIPAGAASVAVIDLTAKPLRKPSSCSERQRLDGLNVNGLDKLTRESGRPKNT